MTVEFDPADRFRHYPLRAARAAVSRGHIPGAVKVDWHTDLHPDTTIVIYGDKSNWWAAWGDAARVPIAVGSEPGVAPGR